jgi:hypothetical protein
VRKYLRIARSRYKQLVVSIETLLDISTLSIEEITGRLKAADDVEPAARHTASGKLLLTEEEWVEKYKKLTGSGHSGSGSGGRGKGRSRGRGRGAGGDSRSSRPPPDDPCPRCGKKGHWARDCRSKKEKGNAAQQAHVAQEEEEATLMLAVGSAHEESASPILTKSAPLPSVPVPELFVLEKKVHAKLDDDPDRDSTHWILDTGASNHMSGSRAAFADLDARVTGSVRFGDGSVARIEGSGTVLFHCKNGEHRALANVYFLPRLTANIISVGQLDEGGYEVLVKHGVMRVWDEDQRLLAKIPRSPGRLYTLEVTIARPVCLAARTDDDAWRWHQRFGHIHFATLRKMAAGEPGARSAHRRPSAAGLRGLPRRQAEKDVVPTEGVVALYRAAAAPPRRHLRPDHTGDPKW